MGELGADALTGRKRHLPLGPVLQQRRHARRQKRADVLRRLQEEDVVAERGVAGRGQTCVGVHEARENRALRVVSPVH